MSEIVTTTMIAEEARRLTDDIKAAVAMTWDLIENAYNGRAWLALGYLSWADYCANEFHSRRLPREERSEIFIGLRQAGLSVRAIAAATGESKSTVNRELAGVPNGTGETIVGTDGKTYPATRHDYCDVNLFGIVIRLPISEEEWRSYLAEAESEPLDVEWCRLLASLGQPLFEEILDQCRAERDLSKENVARHISLKSDATP